MSPTISVSSVRKLPGAVKALVGVDLEVADGHTAVMAVLIVVFGTSLLGDAIEILT